MKCGALLNCLSVVACVLVVAASDEQHRDSWDSLNRHIRQAVTAPATAGPGSACHLRDGRTMGDGSTFAMAVSGPCVTYRCHNGSVLPHTYGCYRDSKCYPLNDKYSLGCIERTCGLVAENHRFDYAITREACSARDQKTCIDVGSSYQDGCFKYRCDKEQQTAFSVSYHLKQIDAGCELKGECIPLNHNYSQGCRTNQCQKREFGVGFYTIQNGCEINGKCVDVGGSIVDSCRTLTCTEENLNGLKILNIKPTKIQCRDANGDCHGDGEWFKLLMDGSVAVNCTCAITGLHYTLSCPSVNFTLNN